MFKNRRGDLREIFSINLEFKPGLRHFHGLLADKFWHVVAKHINHNPPAKIRNLSVDKNLEGKRLQNPKGGYLGLRLFFKLENKLKA